jgi:hypothetical protein
MVLPVKRYPAGIRGSGQDKDIDARPGIVRSVGRELHRLVEIENLPLAVAILQPESLDLRP